MTGWIVPCLTCGVALAAFVAVRGWGYSQFGMLQLCLRVLVALPLAGSGLFLHFWETRRLAEMIPPGFPVPLVLVVLSGVLEVAGAVGLFLPRYRRPAAVLLGLLLMCMLPANVHVAGQVVAGVRMPGVVLRTAMQVVYMWLILISAYGLPLQPTTAIFHSRRRPSRR